MDLKIATSSAAAFILGIPAYRSNFSTDLFLLESFLSSNHQGHQSWSLASDHFSSPTTSLSSFTAKQVVT